MKITIEKKNEDLEKLVEELNVKTTELNKNFVNWFLIVGADYGEIQR